MTDLNLAIEGLAVWRLSHALVKENGPLMIFARIRAKRARRQKRSGGLFDMISCVYCTSFWIALLVGLWHATDLFHWFGYALAASAIAFFLELLADKSNSLTVVASPATHNKIPISISSTPKERDDVVGDPDTSDRETTVKTPPLLLG